MNLPYCIRLCLQNRNLLILLLQRVVLLLGANFHHRPPRRNHRVAVQSQRAGRKHERRCGGEIQGRIEVAAREERCFERQRREGVRWEGAV